MSGYFYGQKIKIKPNIKKRVKTVDLLPLRDNFSSRGYFSSCRALINRLNRDFKIADKDQVDPQRLEELWDDVIKHLLENYSIANHRQLTSKTAHISYVLKQCGYPDNIYAIKQRSLYQLPLDIKQVEKNYAPWEELVKKMKDEMGIIGNLGGFIVLLCYTNGYPLRLGDICNTSINDTKQYNWLDLDNCIWYIKKDFTKNRRARQFEVSPEFCELVLEHVHVSGWLVCKHSGQRYKSAPVLANLNVFSVNVNEVRNSYETWSYQRTDISEKEKHRISVQVLGHDPATAVAHYMPNKLAESMGPSNTQLSSTDDGGGNVGVVVSQTSVLEPKVSQTTDI